MEETIEACVFVPKKSVQIFIKKPGDVAFIRNAIVDVYQSERQLKIQLDYKDCGLAFFDTMASVKPYLQYGLPLEMDSSLSEMLNLAKQFGNLWKADCPNFYVSETECTLEEIQGKEPTQIFDVSCKVISVNVDHDPKLFWIWDGTDVKAEFIRKSNCPDNIWLGPTFNKNCSSLPVPIAENTETQIPSMGTFVPVAVIGERHLLTFPKGWIKLRNLSFVRYQNQIILLYGEDSRWAPVPEIPSIQDRFVQRSENRSFLAVLHKNALSTVIGHSSPLSSLRAVRTFLNQARQSRIIVNEDFHCWVYVVKCRPDPESIVQMALEPQSDMNIEFTLQDATDRIIASLRREQLKYFFNLDALFAGRHRFIKTSLDRALKADPVLYLDVCLNVTCTEGREIVQIIDTVFKRAM